MPYRCTGNNTLALPVPTLHPPTTHISACSRPECVLMQIRRLYLPLCHYSVLVEVGGASIFCWNLVSFSFAATRSLLNERKNIDVHILKKKRVGGIDLINVEVPAWLVSPAWLFITELYCDGEMCLPSPSNKMWFPLPDQGFFSIHLNLNTSWVSFVLTEGSVGRWKVYSSLKGVWENLGSSWSSTSKKMLKIEQKQ